MKLAGVALTGLMLILVGVGLVVGTTSLTGRGQQPMEGPFAGSEPPAEIAMPAFALSDPAGRTVRSEELRGEVVVLTFLDTKCTEACPIIAGQLVHAWRLLGDQERAGTRVIAISTDPRDDTPESVRVFLDTHRASGVISYLRGTVPVMRDLWQRFQILSSLASGEADLHSAPVRIYGRDGTWLATQHAGADLSPRNLAHDVRVALGM
jgi:cytochrome oxidase Cu insertion factor (SCO1/SenC/PrrC family)